MRSSYKRLGDYIREVDIRDTNMDVKTLLGVSIQKVMMPSIANTIGTDMSKYKIVERGQFAYGPVTSRNGDKISIALLEDHDKAIISQAYTCFKIIDENELNAQYLMMWFRRPEFDRYARFKSHGSAREVFDWEEMCNVQLPIPTIDKQREIVAEYNTVQKRINLNSQLIQKLEETAQAIYKQWFVDFEFPDENGKPYKSSGGEMVESELGEIPKGWRVGILSDIANIVMGQSPEGESYNSVGDGIIFYQGRTDFGFRYPDITTFTTMPKKKAKRGDILMSVRAPVGDLNITLNDCAIGRGIASINSKHKCNTFLFYLMQNIKNKFIVSNDEGTIFGSINKDNLYQIDIIVIDTEIMNKFESIVLTIDKFIKLYSEQENNFVKLKSLLLSKLSTQPKP